LNFGSTSPVTITGTSTATATLTITTTAPVSSSSIYAPVVKPIPWYTAGGATLSCVLLLALPRRRRSWWRISGVLLLLVIIGGGLSGCGGNIGRTSNPGTTAGAYIITVTATSGATTAKTTVALTVH
jgi:hypothetical protein